MRRVAVTSLHVDKKGASVGRKLATTKIGRVMGPFCLCHSQAIGFGAWAVCIGRPSLGIAQAILVSAAENLERVHNLWASAASPAH
eukprot:8832187-Pyramimonas_sp.AAC.1